MSGGGERGSGRGLVAKMPIIDRVVRRDLVDLRRAGLGSRLGIDDRRQYAVVDDNLLGGVLGLRVTVSNDDGDFVADVADFSMSQRRTRRRFHRLTVLAGDRPAADMSADLGRGEIRAGEDRNNARHLQSRRNVDFFDRRVRMRRADEKSISLAGPVEVVGIMAPAGDETLVFLAAHCGANPGGTHGSLLPRVLF